jgi:hypothetical protein
VKWLGNTLRKGDATNRNWRRINRVADAAGMLDQEGRRLRTWVEANLSGDEPRTRFPFRVYSIPNTRRLESSADWWRIFYVQHGYVDNVKTDGCDDADGEGTTATEITVEAGVNPYYVWATVTLDAAGVVTAAEIGHGAEGWEDFPAQPEDRETFYALLARIDTETYEAQRRAVVRQFVKQDILLGSAVGGDCRWS